MDVGGVMCGKSEGLWGGLWGKREVMCGKRGGLWMQQGGGNRTLHMHYCTQVYTRLCCVVGASLSERDFIVQCVSMLACLD